MKRIISAILILLLICSLSACGRPKQDSETPETKEPATNTTSDPTGEEDPPVSEEANAGSTQTQPGPADPTPGSDKETDEPSPDPPGLEENELPPIPIG